MNRYVHDMSVNQLYMMSLILIVFGISGWWYFLYNPLIRYSQYKYEEIDTLRSQLSRAVLLQNECEVIDARCATLKKQCNELIEVYCIKEPQVVLHGILKSASNHTLFLDSCETYKTSNNAFGVLYNFKSSYEDFLDFLNALEEVGYTHQLNSFTLTKSSESEIKSMLKFEFSNLDELL